MYTSKHASITKYIFSIIFITATILHCHHYHFFLKDTFFTDRNLQFTIFTSHPPKEQPTNECYAKNTLKLIFITFWIQPYFVAVLFLNINKVSQTCNKKSTTDNDWKNSITKWLLKTKYHIARFFSAGW